MAPPPLIDGKIPKGTCTNLNQIKQLSSIYDIDDVPILEDWNNLHKYIRYMVDQYARTDPADVPIKWSSQPIQAKHAMVERLVKRFPWLERFEEQWPAEMAIRQRIRNARTESQRGNVGSKLVGKEAETIISKPLYTSDAEGNSHGDLEEVSSNGEGVSMPIKSEKRSIQISRHKREADEIEEVQQTLRAEKKAKVDDNKLKKETRALMKKRLDAKIEQIMARQERTKRPEVENCAQLQLEDTPGQEVSAATAPAPQGRKALKTPKTSTAQAKGRKGRKGRQ